LWKSCYCRELHAFDVQEKQPSFFFHSRNFAPIAGDLSIEAFSGAASRNRNCEHGYPGETDTVECTSYSVVGDSEEALLASLVFLVSLVSLLPLMLFFLFEGGGGGLC
jgi:hypothetical protein